MQIRFIPTRFRLRTLLVVIALIGLPLGYLSNLWWAMQREIIAMEYITTHGGTIYPPEASKNGKQDTYPPQWFLKLVGREGFVNADHLQFYSLATPNRSNPLAFPSTPNTWYSVYSIDHRYLDPSALSYVTHLHRLREIRCGRIDGRDILPADLKSVGVLPFLERLTVNSSSFRPDKDYSCFSNFPNLRWLRFESSPVGGKSFVDVVKPLRKLESLSVRSDFMTDESLSGLSDSTTLGRLILGGGRFSAAGLRQICGKNLTGLSVANCSLEDSIELGEVLSSFVNLESLYFENTQVGDKTIAALHLPQLKEVVLLKCPIGDKSLLALSQLPSLRYLEVDSSRFSEEALSDFRRTTHIRID